MQCLAPLRCGLGGDQIGDTLGGGQIHLAVKEGAARKFAGLCLAQPGSRQGFDHPGNNAASTMQMQLSCIFAGIGSRPWKPKHKGVVQRLLIRRA
jgi:hypothetical protein